MGSLRRGIGKTSTPELAGGQRKTKAAMIWKKGWKGWKKLHSFGNNSNKTGESFVLFVTSILYHAIQITAWFSNRCYKNILKIREFLYMFYFIYIYIC